ncbi:MAG: AAA family ATPase [Rhodoferax sp.]|nr:AAA family ATPase [Rhodoferax sp.]MCB2028365.1 AAA family ATPase [Rhodoferax sp.]MCB2041349.1 AAA family ATPase [Rhodoferax sp.]
MFKVTGQLRAREREIGAVQELLQRARSGAGAALVLKGPAGIGKTALLDQALLGAHGMRVLRSTAVEFESGFPFAGLHQLCGPLLAQSDALPPPQRDALQIAFGTQDGPAPHPLLIGLATLTLLSGAADEQPTACVVDDAHWLDHASAQVLAFVARRVAGEPIAMLFGARDDNPLVGLTGLPELVLAGLSDAVAMELLASVVPMPLDERVRDRILAEARGNPLALLELGAGAGAMEMAGGFGVSQKRRPPVEGLYSQRLAAFPTETRLLLLIAAAEPQGDPLLLWRAAARLGIGSIALGPAEDAGMMEIDDRVRFRHPLVRSAVYGAASAADRRRVHEALAQATDAARYPDWHAWHRAHGVTGLDERVATALIETAERARARGGLAATAAFLRRAADLTPNLSLRVDRMVGAAQAQYQSGALADALSLLDAVDADAMDALQQARTQLLRGRIVSALRRGSDAPGLLLRAAISLEPLDLCLARETHLDALFAELSARPCGAGIVEAAHQALAAPQGPGKPRTADLLLNGMAQVLLGQREPGVLHLRKALADPASEVWTNRSRIASQVALELWDLEASEGICNCLVRRARGCGALAELTTALGTLASVLIGRGQLRSAEVAIAESDAIADATGTIRFSYVALRLAAARGQVALAQQLIHACSEDAVARGEGLLVVATEFAAALLYNGIGEPAQALAAAQRARSQVAFGILGLVLRELIEAAVQLGEHAVAMQALAELRERTQAARTPWALGVQACCEALLADTGQAQACFLQAIAHLERSHGRVDLARTRLLYGQWLCRQQRRSDAREQLHMAHDALSAMGADGFARRAADELQSVGERAQRRGQGAIDALTPQELQIARMAASGETAKEIASGLFISPRTVEAHLRNTYAKLGITSRRQLRALPLQDAIGEHA